MSVLEHPVLRFFAIGLLLALLDVSYDLLRMFTWCGLSGIPLYVIYATCFAIPTAVTGVGILTGSVWLDLLLFTVIYWESSYRSIRWDESDQEKGERSWQGTRGCRRYFWLPR